ncbi:MAG: hypothetical protein AAGG75_11490 [Bacteroidota bacterium]
MLINYVSNNSNNHYWGVFLLSAGFLPPNHTAPSYIQSITLSDGINPRSSSAEFRFGISGIDDCTYLASEREEIIIRARIRIFRSNGEVLCAISEPIDHQDNTFGNSIIFPGATLNQGENVTIRYDFVAYPPESPTCFGPALSCGSSLTKCCFEFECCDCGQWNGVLLEGFWYESTATTMVPEEVDTYTFLSDLTPIYPPNIPSPNTTSDPFEGGCECCAH